jgi:hypothetical protein
MNISTSVARRVVAHGDPDTLNVLKFAHGKTELGAQACPSKPIDFRLKW